VTVTYEALVARASGWLAPVPGASPGGAPVRLDPAYQAVAAEVAKLSAPTGQPVDWPAVERGAGAILRDKCKDLAVAAYLARALLATRGPAGLVDGLALLCGLVDGFWETMQPEASRLKGRANAVQWLLERAVPALEALPEAKGEAEVVDGLELLVGRLGEALRARLGDATPGFGPFREAVARLRPMAEPELESSPTAAAPAPPAPVEASPTSAVGVPSAGEGDPGQALARFGAALVELAGRLREAAPASPSGYRVLRVGLWLHLEQPPPSTGGKTAIPPPPPALLSRLALLEENRQWAALLDEVESNLPLHRFALGLQRLAVAALRGLGGEHARAAAGVEAEVRGLLQRMPALAAATFADGSPLADGRTRTWLEEAAPGGGSPKEAAGVSQQGLPDVADAARHLAEGRIQEGLAAFQASFQQVEAGRARFLLRLELARRCAASGQVALALATYRGLDAEAQQHRLEDWEPGLAADILQGLIMTLRSVSKEARGPASELDDCMRRLCRLDPAAAYQAGS